MQTLPKIGARIIKSAIAVSLCYVVQLFRGDDGIVFYSQLSALWCMQSYISTTKKNAIQRTIGTILGAIFGLIILLTLNFINREFSLSENVFYSIKGILISLSIIPLIWITVLLKKKHASYFSCVVFLSIVVVHLSDQNCYFFVFNRFLDTMIGIIIGVSVNLFHLPREKHTDVLFISGIDDTLLDKENHLNDYCKVELNRMIDDGLNFTLSTIRPPASLIEKMSDIHLKLPVIAMDGAVLYDVQKKRYLEKIELQEKDKNEILKFFEENQISYFSNVVIDDTLLIYYQKLDCEIQKKLIEELRDSPHRNYIKRNLPENEKVVYFMLIYPDEKIEEIYSLLKSRRITENLRILKYKSCDYKGNSYIKIFDKTATRNNMIECLKRRLRIQKTITFGTIENKYDFVIKEGDANEVVHKIKKLFEQSKIAIFRNFL